MNGPSPSLPLEHRRVASRLALELHALLRESEAKPPVVRAVIRELAYLAGCEGLFGAEEVAHLLRQATEDSGP